jgi:hypothetical protein
VVVAQIGPRRGKGANGSAQRGEYCSIRGRRWYLLNVPDKIVDEDIRALMLEVGWRDGLERWRDGGLEGWRGGGGVVGWWWDGVKA